VSAWPRATATSRLRAPLRCAISAGTPWARMIGKVGSSPEVCDGLDNNCDGFVDNGTGRAAVVRAVKRKR